MDEKEKIIKEYLKEKAKKLAEARWKDHEKQTPEEKKIKKREYMKEYRKKKKESL